MGSLAEFLSPLLFDGRVAFSERPVREGTDSEAIEVLERAYGSYRLEVAGPPIAFELGIALEASELVRQACWALIDHGEAPEVLAHRLRMSRAPQSPADHLSADLLLRFLPQIHRRAKALGPSDPLVGQIADVLRQWPLSGVLAALEPGPESPVELGEHPGLMLLYAERWAREQVASWRPGGGGLEFVELVLGRTEGPDPSAAKPSGSVGYV